MFFCVGRETLSTVACGPNQHAFTSEVIATLGPHADGGSRARITARATDARHERQAGAYEAMYAPHTKAVRNAPSAKAHPRPRSKAVSGGSPPRRKSAWAVKGGRAHARRPSKTSEGPTADLLKAPSLN